MIEVAFFQFLAVLVGAVTVVAVVGTVFGLWHAREMARRAGHVPLDPPSRGERRAAREELESWVLKGVIPGVEAILLTRGHHLPAEIRENAQRWLHEKKAAVPAGQRP